MDTSIPANVTDLFNADGLVVVISGAGSGIGLAFTHALSKNGAAKVFVLGRRLESLQDAAKATNPSIVIPVQCDVTNADSLAAAVKTISSQTKHIDVLVNNAGILGPSHGGLLGATSIEDLSQQMLQNVDGWAQAYAINTTAVATVSASFLPLLHAGNVRRGWPAGKVETFKRERVPEGFDARDVRTSQIITVSSIASMNRYITAGLAYTASKAGATMLGKSLSNLLAPWGIRSNLICPGRFPSDMTANGPTEFPITQIPAGQQGQFEDMAGTILWLVGKSGAYNNGNVVVLDGGRLSVMPATY